MEASPNLFLLIRKLGMLAKAPGKDLRIED